MRCGQERSQQPITQVSVFDMIIIPIAAYHSRFRCIFFLQDKKLAVSISFLGPNAGASERFVNTLKIVDIFKLPSHEREHQNHVFGLVGHQSSGGAWPPDNCRFDQNSF